MRKITWIIISFISFKAFIVYQSETGANSGYENISCHIAKHHLEIDSSIFLLDVRINEEYYNGHILDAVNINIDSINSNYHLLPNDNETGIIVYCNSGFRSKTAAETLVENGKCNMSNMEDGFNEWKKNGYPFIIGSNPDPTSLGEWRRISVLCNISITTITIIQKLIKKEGKHL